MGSCCVRGAFTRSLGLGILSQRKRMVNGSTRLPVGFNSLRVHENRPAMRLVHPSPRKAGEWVAGVSPGASHADGAIPGRDGRRGAKAGVTAGESCLSATLKAP